MDELQHVIECLVAIKKAKKQVLKDFGFNYSTFKEAQERVIGAIPEEGISAHGYKVNVVSENVYARKLDEQKIMDVKKRIQLNEDRN